MFHLGVKINNDNIYIYITNKNISLVLILVSKVVL